MDSNEQYKLLISAWSSGIASYNSLFSAYLAANSIFIAASVLLARTYLDPDGDSIVAALTVCVAITGIYVSLQMSVALSRFSGQNSYFEWVIRGIESKSEFKGIKIFGDLRLWREKQTAIVNEDNDPREYLPNWAVRVHRYKYAARSKAMPFVFILVQLIVISIVAGHYLTC